MEINDCVHFVSIYSGSHLHGRERDTEREREGVVCEKERDEKKDERKIKKEM